MMKQAQEESTESFAAILEFINSLLESISKQCQVCCAQDKNFEDTSKEKMAKASFMSQENKSLANQDTDTPRHTILSILNEQINTDPSMLSLYTSDQRNHSPSIAYSVASQESQNSLQSIKDNNSPENDSSSETLIYINSKGSIVSPLKHNVLSSSSSKETNGSRFSFETI